MVLLPKLDWSNDKTLGYDIVVRGKRLRVFIPKAKC